MILSITSNAQNLSHETKGNFIIKSFSYYQDDKEIDKSTYKELIKNDALAFERLNKHLRNKNWANVFEILGNKYGAGIGVRFKVGSGLLSTFLTALYLMLCYPSKGYDKRLYLFYITSYM